MAKWADPFPDSCWKQKKNHIMQIHRGYRFPPASFCHPQHRLMLRLGGVVVSNDTSGIECLPVADGWRRCTGRVSVGGGGLHRAHRLYVPERRRPRPSVHVHVHTHIHTHYSWALGFFPLSLLGVCVSDFCGYHGARGPDLLNSVRRQKSSRLRTRQVPHPSLPLTDSTLTINTEINLRVEVRWKPLSNLQFYQPRINHLIGGGAKYTWKHVSTETREITHPPTLWQSLQLNNIKNTRWWRCLLFRKLNWCRFV